MAVVSCKAQRPGQSYSFNEKNQQTAPVKFFIETNDPLDGPITVEAQCHSVGPNPVPRAYDPYAIGNDFNQYLLARKVTIYPVGNTNLAWVATVEYDNTLDPGQKEENPLLRAPIDTWDNEQFQRAIEKDVFDQPIVNPCGEQFDPPIQVDDSRPILTYTRNEASYPSQILFYQDAINSDSFLIFPPYSAKVNITATKKFEGQYKYYETRYVFHFRRNKWKREALNRGTKFRVSAGGVIHSLPPGEKPVLLKEDGTIATSATASYTDFDVYEELPFGPLNIYIV